MKNFKTFLILVFSLFVFTTASAQDYTSYGLYGGTNFTVNTNHLHGGIRIAGVDDGMGAYGKIGYRYTDSQVIQYEGFELSAGPEIVIDQSDDMMLSVDGGLGIVHLTDVVESGIGSDPETSGLFELGFNMFKNNMHFGTSARYVQAGKQDVLDGFEISFTVGTRLNYAR